MEKSKEGPNRNITPLLGSEEPQKGPDGSPVMFVIASSSSSNACSPWMLSISSSNSSLGCFCFDLKLPFFGFLTERGIVGRGLADESEDDEVFLL